MDFADTADALIDAGRVLHQRGWVPATSGNFSCRIDDSKMAITVSGWHKGELTREGIMRADLDGNSLDEGRRPSAETPLHCQLYKRFPEVGAVLHTHSMNATLISRLQSAALVLEDYELLKAFHGVRSHDQSITVPIFANDQDIPRLVARVAKYMDTHAPIFGYLIGGHGLYTWGRDVREAMRHLEAFEFLLACEMKLQEVRKP